MVRAHLLIILSCITAQAQNRQQAFDMNERLGRGINIGNTFEAPSETEWGNPWKASYFKMISELGFSHVRVPVRWETAERSMTSTPYTITPSFLDRIQEVVDSALRYKLHVIINMHHHDALFEDPAGQRDRFLSQWSQIANHFKDYPDSLLFEVLNEPHGNLTASMWNDYFDDALAAIRQTNPTRIVLMGVAEYGGLGAVGKLELPPDENIILSVHYYNPFSFTHQGAEWVAGANSWLGTEWKDTEADRQTVESEFAHALQFSENNNIPLHVGEFGAYSKADQQSRDRWTTFLARWFEEKNLSWAYWEFSAGFGIYNPATKQYLPGLVDALLHNEIPEPTPVFSKPVYASNFSGSNDGWSLNEQGGASGDMATSGNTLSVAISAGGTEAWHLQLVRNNIRLEEGRLYRLSFTATSTADRSITFYAGKASTPWNAYSGYYGVMVTPQEMTHTFTFTMADPTDPASRLVFDLGLNTEDVNITSVKVEELRFTITSVDDQSVERQPYVFPNPTSAFLSMRQAERYEAAQLFDLNGRLIATFQTEDGFDITHLPSGLYIISLTGKTTTPLKIRVIKK